MDRQIPLGIASLGLSGRVFHLPLLMHHPQFCVKGILRRSTAMPTPYPAVAVFRSFEEMLADNGIELIVINTPDPTHFVLTMQALEAGKHVVVEKPFMQTVEQCREAITLARRMKKEICVFQNRRWDGDFLTVRKLLREKRLGRVVEYEAHWDRYKRAVQPNRWKDQSASGTGLLYNLGSHLIDQAVVLFGVPEAVTARMKTLRTGGEVDDWFHLWLHYPDVQVSLRSSYLAREPGPRYLIHGELGSFVKYGIDPQEQDLIQGRNPADPAWGKDSEEFWGILHTQDGERTIRRKIETERGNYQSFYDSVYNCIAGSGPCAVLPEEATSVIQVIEAAKRSNESGVTLPIGR